MCGGHVSTNGKTGVIGIDDNLLVANKSFSCEWDVKPSDTEPSTITFSYQGILSPSWKQRSSDCQFALSRIMVTDSK